MYLKSIEIFGFKSFADKTRVDLKQGITGIIGPNGCGKSNIMEAIRWCIGEMSWKSLRSDSMVSVIFAGSARRSALGLCEVALTFDNAQSLLPVQYSEVSVSRRIYRSGESEYYLNKVQCRLRDIRELFLDTGIGGDGYAIIDQGGVDFVLSSKPEDRRALFEEAAGVAKYKTKREEALRKLERLDIDLARLQDSLSLINDQIRKLDSDARKANLYQKYKQELAVLEARQLAQEIAQIDAEISKEAALLTPIAERLSQAQTELQAEEGRLAALNLEKSRQEASAMESNQKMAALKSEIGRLEERLQNTQSATQELKARIASSQVELEGEMRREAELVPELEALSAAQEKASQDLAKARQEHQDFEKVLERLQAELESAQLELETSKSEVLIASQACQELARNLSSAESELGRLDYQARSVLREHDRKSLALESAQKGLGEIQEAVSRQNARVEEKRKALEQLETQRESRRKELAALGEEILGRHADLARLQAHLEALKVQSGRDPYWVGAHAVLNAGIRGLWGTVRSLLQVEEAYRPFVEDALGERLYAVVCADAKAAEAGVEFLKASGKGRARFLVASSLSQNQAAMTLPPQAKPILDHIQYDARYEPVLRYLLAQSYVLEGDLYGPHWVCGGALEGELPFKPSDMETLQARLTALQREQEECENRKSSLHQALSELEERVKAAASHLQEESSKGHALQAQYSQKQESLRLQEQEWEGILGEIAQVLAEMAQVKERMHSLHHDLEKRRQDEELLRGRENQALGRYDALKEELAKRRAEQLPLGTALTHLKTQQDFLNSQFDRLKSSQDSLKRSIERRRVEERQWEARVSELAQVAEESGLQLDEHRRCLAIFEQESQNLFETLQKMLESSKILEESLRAKKAELAQSQEEVHSFELKASQLTARRDLLKGRLSQEWKLTPEEALVRHAEGAVDPEKIEFLRRRIEALGNVNMAAPEEYEELKSKHDFLQSQVADLLKAQEDLKSAIAKINATTRENFRQTFHEVREHFRKLYGVLFDGGEADLVLTDRENLLETGIDIVAQPPGKRLQSISLLSGGEKTLTAIALLFAFFMVKPSPVCMLDEADAALDDANVDRFVSLLREFGGKTQFLIVSHNKKTMEACELLYGVTMEESGVSQIISVDFRKKSQGEAAPAQKAAQTDESAATTSS